LTSSFILIPKKIIPSIFGPNAGKVLLLLLVKRGLSIFYFEAGEFLF